MRLFCVAHDDLGPLTHACQNTTFTVSTEVALLTNGYQQRQRECAINYTTSSGAEISARSIYPGGQSGNPLSRYYDDRITQWQNGDLDIVVFPRTPDELDPSASTATLVLRPEMNR